MKYVSQELDMGERLLRDMLAKNWAWESDCYEIYVSHELDMGE